MTLKAYLWSDRVGPIIPWPGHSMPNARRPSLTSNTDRFPLVTAGRTAKLGLVFGVVYGGVQDLLGLARGRSIGYLETISRFGSPSGHAVKTSRDS